MPDPRKVPFTTGFFGIMEDGTAWGSDEYGRPPRDNDPNVKATRDMERRAFENAKKAWDDQFGKLSVEERDRYFFG